ncbi:MAG TPA: heparinase, partial [Bacteroidetes bacterium]|nr:heparinase [Bacteroidota bacterium]
MNGKLWTYNLNYFEYLNQENISKGEALDLIRDYIQNFDNIKDGLDPYPTSLRIMNWIKFIVSNNISDTKIDENLFAQVYILYHGLEYHLLGNHLLENAFALTI